MNTNRTIFFIIVFFMFCVIFFFVQKILPFNLSIIKNISKERYFNEEWESLKNRQFFKKASLFYFSDLNLLMINFISLNQESSFYVQVFLKSADNEFSKIYKTSQIKKIYRIASAEFKILMLNLDPESINFLNKNKNTTFSIKILDNHLESNIQNSISVKIKKFQSSSKKNLIICSKCLFNYSNKKSGSLKWWIELNKRLGYQKISLCNYSIENSDVYAKMFEKYSNFVEITQLKFIPDMNQDENGAPKFIQNFKFSERNFHVYFDLITEFILNECYYNNLDQYKFITVVDADETIIPKSSRFPTQKSVFEYIKNSNKISHGTFFDRLKCQNESLTIESYITKLSAKYPTARGRSVYFLQGLFMSYDKMEKIFESIRNVLNKGEKLPISVKVKYDNESEIIVNVDQSNVDYAKKLLEFDKNIIGPFWKKNEKHLANFSFSRFYYLSGANTNFLYGKTIHDTDKSFRVQTHQSIWQIYSGKLRNTIDQTSVKIDDGIDGHFRSKISSRVQKISFNEIHLDIFYLNCFLIPILNSF